MGVPAQHYIRARLVALQFLEYFVWGAWVVPISGYMNGSLGFNGTEIGWICGAWALAAIVSPLFVGYVADRFFSSERILGALHLAGALCLFLAARQTTFPALLTAVMINALCFMPTLPLADNLIFRNIDNADKFSRIAVGGSIGWIVAGLVVGLLLGESTGAFFRLAAGAQAALALYSLTLPHTPPRGRPEAGRDVLGLRAARLLREPAFLVFAGVIPLIAVSKTFYTTWTNAFLNELNLPGPTALMTLSQASDVLVKIALPWFIAKIGLKNVLVAGMVTWAIRYFAFASMEVPAIVMGLLLHGFSYGFVVTGASIYASRVAPPGMGARAQSFIALLVFGVGTFFGAQVAGFTGQMYGPRSIPAARTTPAGVERWARVPLPDWSAFAAPHDAVRLATIEKLPEDGMAIERAGTLRYARRDLLAAFRDADRDGDGVVSRADWQRIRLHAWPQIWSWGAALAMVACVLFWIGGREPRPATE